METKNLALLCAQKCLEKKAENIVILDLEGKSSVADYFVLASGATDRQASAIASHIADTLRAEGIKPLHEEGINEGRWALVDFGSVIVHIFQDSLRHFYDLEAIWPNAPRQRIVDENTHTTYADRTAYTPADFR